MDALFVTPTTKKNILKECYGTMLLSTILRKEGVDVAIYPFHRFGDPEKFDAFLESAVDIICEAKPKILSFYTLCNCYHVMLRIAELVKQRIDCYVVLGGPQADILARETMEEIPYVDFVCCGEGETTVYPLFSSLLKGEPDLSIRGLVYRGENGVVVNPRPALLQDLDSLPFLDFSIFPPDAHCDTSEFFPIDVGRGCPFGCTYCSTSNFWGRRFRLKTPEHIVKELKYYHELLGVTKFQFNHDMFTMNRKLVLETCRLIRELDFKVTWNCSARADCLDEALIDAMVEAGLVGIFIGVETGSERMQKRINKNLKLDAVGPIVSYIRSKNIHITTSFIHGFPEETEEDVSKTLAMIVDHIRMRNISVQAHLCAFLPGTAMSEEYKDRLVPAKNFSDITGELGMAQCADLLQAHPRLFWHFNEFKTELRKKLEFYTLFVALFQARRAVYLYLSEKYPRENLIQMYFDFVEANQELLSQMQELSLNERFDKLQYHDAFIERFAEDERAAQIADAYRLELAKLSVLNGKQKSASLVSCVNPENLVRCESLRDCPQTWCMVTYAKDENGALKITVNQ